LSTYVDRVTKRKKKAKNRFFRKKVELTNVLLMKSS
jgi:hypothetical protein